MSVEELSSIQLPKELSLCSVAVTPSGVLIVSCGRTASLYAVRPSTGHCQRVAGDGGGGTLKDSPALSAKFCAPRGVVVADSECCAYVCDLWNHAIRRITLPPEYFEPPFTGHSHHSLTLHLTQSLILLLVVGVF